MRRANSLVLAWLALGLASAAHAQSGSLEVPQRLNAGDAFSIPTSGSGKGVLYIVGPGQVLRRDVQLGQAVSFAAGALYDAGHYIAALTAGTSTETGELDVAPAKKPDTLSFLAKPSRLPVGLHDGISGSVFTFDAYNNLITTPMPVSFELSEASGAAQSRTVNTRDGVAWTRMDSAPKQGAAKFVAHTADVSSTRIIQEVPGDPCGLSISAQPDSGKLTVQTAPIRDCSGNAVPDGTIVTFTETYGGEQSTVDVPVKQGFAKVDMPAVAGAKISVASGVVAGNEIRWGGGR
jgi:hypothetical protein